MGATIAVSEDLAKELKVLKLEEGRRSMEELLREIVAVYKKKGTYRQARNLEREWRQRD